MQDFRIRAVGDCRVGQAVTVLLDQAGVRVDAEDVPVPAHQLAGERAAEAAQADDGDPLVTAVGEPGAGAFAAAQYTQWVSQ